MLQPCQNTLELCLVRLIEDQALAKITQNLVAQAGVAQGEMKRILPVYPYPSCVDGLPIGESFMELEYRHEAETIWQFSGYNLLGIETRQINTGQELIRFHPDRDVSISFSESRFRSASSILGQRR